MTSANEKMTAEELTKVINMILLDDGKKYKTKFFCVFRNPAMKQ